MAELESYIVLAGRVLYSMIFVVSGIWHFQNSGSLAAFAQARGVPLPHAAVMGSGLLILAGGLSVLFGFRARLGSALLLLFLVPVTLVMHRPLSDPLQATQALKNLALMGGALMILVHGSGPLSLDRLKRRDPATAALP
ncbi:MAG: DoxX family protein [Acidobacteriota bacterium]